MNVLTGVVIVSFNCSRLVERCLASLLSQTVKPSLIVIVDNNSSLNDIHHTLSLKSKSDTISVLCLDSNIGFGKACNHGIRNLLDRGCEYIWLLNPDALADANAFSSLYEMAESNSDLGAIGSLICDQSRGHMQQYYGGFLCSPTWMTFSAHNSQDLSKKYSWVTGASMLLRRNALIECGLFSPYFFMYYEDAELCWRFKNAGWSIGCCATSIVYHNPGSSVADLTSKRYEWHFLSGIAISCYFPMQYVWRLGLVIKYIVLFISRRIFLDDLADISPLKNHLFEHILWRSPSCREHLDAALDEL